MPVRTVKITEKDIELSLIHISSETSFSLRFAGIIQRACEKTGQRVVILVDEYDKPMLLSLIHI